MLPSTPGVAPLELASRLVRGGDGSLLFPRWLSHHSTSSTPSGSSGLHLQALHPFHGLRPLSPGSAPDCAPRGATVSTRQTSLHVADWWVALAHGELDPALQRPDLSARWRAATQVAWSLLWPDLHWLVIVSFAGRTKRAVPPGLSTRAGIIGRNRSLTVAARIALRWREGASGLRSMR